jgi:hypothetical protein
MYRSAARHLRGAGRRFVGTSTSPRSQNVGSYSSCNFSFHIINMLRPALKFVGVFERDPKRVSRSSIQASELGKTWGGKGRPVSSPDRPDNSEPA